MDDLVKGSIKQLGNFGKAARDEGREVAKAAAHQVGIERVGEEKGKQLEQGAQTDEAAKALQSQEDKDFVEKLYAPSQEKKPHTKEEEEKQKAFAEFAEKHAGKSPEEIQEMYKVRQQLHKESYYDPLVAKSEVHDQKIGCFFQSLNKIPEALLKKRQEEQKTLA